MTCQGKSPRGRQARGPRLNARPRSHSLPSSGSPPRSPSPSFFSTSLHIAISSCARFSPPTFRRFLLSAFCSVQGRDRPAKSSTAPILLFSIVFSPQRTPSHRSSEGAARAPLCLTGEHPEPSHATGGAAARGRPGPLARSVTPRPGVVPGAVARVWAGSRASGRARKMSHKRTPLSASRPCRRSGHRPIEPVTDSGLCMQKRGNFKATSVGPGWQETLGNPRNRGRGRYADRVAAGWHRF